MSKFVWLSRLGVTVFATVSVGALAVAPAQATADGVASVSGTKVTFKAAKGKQNSVGVTRSGNTITIDDRVKVRAGKGCKPVKGDRTMVTCTTSKKPTAVHVYTYDRDDAVANKARVGISVWGGAGDDLIFGGAQRDYLIGGAGNDELFGLGGFDFLSGGAGNDYHGGGGGDDRIEAGPGDDVLDGEGGYDELFGMAGRDRINGGSGNDYLSGHDGTGSPAADRLNGGSNGTSRGDVCEAFSRDVKVGCER